jgi:hypothetical protein
MYFPTVLFYFSVFVFWPLSIARLTGCQWLMPVILAIQEAEIRRITVQDQPRKIVHKTLS